MERRFFPAKASSRHNGEENISSGFFAGEKNR
jgi:hypothetical protein